MSQPSNTVTPSVRQVAIDAQSQVPSSALLNHQGKLWIEHGGERYLLRRTANNRLILTK